MNQTNPIPVYVALIHHPVLDRSGQVVATNITNFDIHDIARACRTYGVDRYFLIHPMREQLMFVERVLDHWRVGLGFKFNPKRKEALVRVETAESVADCLGKLPQRPFLVATSAQSKDKLPQIPFKEMRQSLSQEKYPQGLLLLFGTGFGLHDKVLGECDAVLEPIRGQWCDDFRHLSVRSAASICLDRLLGA